MRLTLTLILCIVAFTNFSQCYIVSGKVTDLQTKVPVSFCFVRIFYQDCPYGDTARLAKTKRHRVDSCYSDKNGNFLFDLHKSGYYSVICRIPVDTLGYRYDSRDEFWVGSDTVFVELTPEAYCEYDQYRNLNSCPICFRKDSLLKVVYGLPIQDPDNPYRILSNKDEYWIGYCSYDRLCHATRYCARCRKLF